MAAFEKISSQDVPDGQVVALPGAQSAADSKLAEQILGFLVKTLSQRTVAVASALFTILALASCWFIWFKIMDDPTNARLIGAGVYSVFVLAFEYVRRR